MLGDPPPPRTTDNDSDLPEPQRRGGLYLRKPPGDAGKPKRSLRRYPEIAFELLGYEEELVPSLLLHLRRRTAVSPRFQRPDLHSGLKAGRIIYVRSVFCALSFSAFLLLA